ncbi:MAG: rubredoxin [candidate division WOR-3 bacterium]
MKKYRCTICGYVYDPMQGDPDGGVPSGTPFESLPEDWVCPICGAPKADFEEVED